MYLFLILFVWNLPSVQVKHWTGIPNQEGEWRIKLSPQSTWQVIYPGMELHPSIEKMLFYKLQKYTVYSSNGVHMGCIYPKEAFCFLICTKIPNGLATALYASLPDKLYESKHHDCFYHACTSNIQHTTWNTSRCSLIFAASLKEGIILRHRIIDMYFILHVPPGFNGFLTKHISVSTMQAALVSQ